MPLGKIIVYTTERKKIGEYTINQDVFRIGRSADNDLTLPDPLISGHHCKISPTMLDPLLEDMNSTNGTYVNFEKVKNHALRNTDILMFKNYLIKFVSDVSLPPDDPSTQIPEDTVTTFKDWWLRRKAEEDGKPFKIQRSARVTTMG